MSPDSTQHAEALTMPRSRDDAPENLPATRGDLWQLILLGAISTCLYGIVSFLSRRFDYHVAGSEHPILQVLGLFAITFGLYLWAIRLVARAPQNGQLLRLIVWYSIAFRAVMLFSVPIQEIDIYRYLWDGSVTTAGVSPFRFSPEEVRSASADSPVPEDLRRLAQLRDSQPTLAEILRRVHYGELPTIYPPTSQLVFAAATFTTPSTAPVIVRVFFLKAWFIAFDLATLFVVIGLLKLCRKPVGLCVIYGWCPLLMKEVANSGHLDAVAVFLTTSAIYLVARLVSERKHVPDQISRTIFKASWMCLILGFAVGAKLYPIILAPLLLVVATQAVGWRNMVFPSVVFALTVFVVLWPMLPQDQNGSLDSHTVASDSAAPTPLPNASSKDPSLGVKTFLRRWEMNDFLFLVLVENLKLTATPPSEPGVWFSIVPQSIRLTIVNSVETWFQIERQEIPFLTARAITLGIFLLISVWLIRRAARTGGLDSFFEACFLTLAWFCLLCPTQNPWYWTWTLPMLPFARSRAWLALSGLVLLYYLRFWFSYHWPESPVWGTNYHGHAFFDFVVTWIEFAPWFIWLAAGRMCQKLAINHVADISGRRPESHF